jgi:hypothetical protein
MRRLCGGFPPSFPRIFRLLRLVRLLRLQRYGFCATVRFVLLFMLVSFADYCGISVWLCCSSLFVLLCPSTVNYCRASVMVLGAARFESRLNIPWVKLRLIKALVLLALMLHWHCKLESTHSVLIVQLVSPEPLL